MSKSQDDWKNMSANERQAYTATQLAEAVKTVTAQSLPTGIKVMIGGKQFIARPGRVTESGGVTYNLSPQSTSVGEYNARLNKFSFTLLGSGATEETPEWSDERLA